MLCLYADIASVLVTQLPEVHSICMDIHNGKAVPKLTAVYRWHQLLCADVLSKRKLVVQYNALPHEKYTVDCLLAYFKGAESRLSVTPNSEVSRLRASTVLAFLSARASLVSLLPSPLENLSQSDSSSESLSDPKSERREACRGSRTLLGLYDTAKRSRCGVLLKW